ncbi:MAG: CbtB domain-containing protein [Solirubrobacteraceae bacterium]
MSDVVASSAPLPGAVYSSVISLREIWPWALFGLALLMLVYFVGVEQGASALAAGNLVHEFVHDGRHLLAFPCH